VTEVLKRPQAAFSSPRLQFFTIRTDPKPASNDHDQNTTRVHTSNIRVYTSNLRVHTSNIWDIWILYVLTWRDNQILQIWKKVRLFYLLLEERERGLIDQFRYIKIQPTTMNPSTRLWGITTEFVEFIPQSLMSRSIALGWMLIYRNWSIHWKKRYHRPPSVTARHTQTPKPLLCYYFKENNSMRHFGAPNFVCNHRNLCLFDVSRSIALGWILRYRNWSIHWKKKFHRPPSVTVRHTQTPKPLLCYYFEENNSVCSHRNLRLFDAQRHISQRSGLFNLCLCGACMENVCMWHRRVCVWHPRVWGTCAHLRMCTRHDPPTCKNKM